VLLSPDAHYVMALAEVWTKKSGSTEASRDLELAPERGSLLSVIPLQYRDSLSANPINHDGKSSSNDRLGPIVVLQP
jgi:hypothetical protein